MMESSSLNMIHRNKKWERKKAQRDKVEPQTAAERKPINKHRGQGNTREERQQKKAKLETLWRKLIETVLN